MSSAVCEDCHEVFHHLPARRELIAGDFDGSSRLKVLLTLYQLENGFLRPLRLCFRCLTAAYNQRGRYISQEDSHDNRIADSTTP